MLESVKEKNKASSHSLPNTSPLNELQNRAHKFSLMTTHSKAHKLRYIMHYSIQKLLCAMMEIEGKQQEEKCLARFKKPRHITQCTLNSQ